MPRRRDKPTGRYSHSRAPTSPPTTAVPGLVDDASSVIYLTSQNGCRGYHSAIGNTEAKGGSHVQSI